MLEAIERPWTIYVEVLNARQSWWWWGGIAGDSMAAGSISMKVIGAREQGLLPQANDERPIPEKSKGTMSKTWHLKTCRDRRHWIVQGSRSDTILQEGPQDECFWSLSWFITGILMPVAPGSPKPSATCWSAGRPPWCCISPEAYLHDLHVCSASPGTRTFTESILKMASGMLCKPSGIQVAGEPGGTDSALLPGFLLHTLRLLPFRNEPWAASLY